MKIHTKIVIDLASGEVLEDEGYEYDGPVAEAGGSPPSQPDTTTQIQEPWEQQKPFLEKGFARAEADVFNRPLEFFPSSTVTPYSPETEFALGAQTSRAMQGSPLIRGAQNEIGRLLSGSYLPGMPVQQNPQWATPSLAQQGGVAQLLGGGKGPSTPGDQGDPMSPPTFSSPFQPAPGQLPPPADAPNLPPPATNLVAPPPEPGSEPAPTAVPQLGDIADGPPGGGLPPTPAPEGMRWENIGNRQYRLVSNADPGEFD